MSECVEKSWLLNVTSMKMHTSYKVTGSKYANPSTVSLSSAWNHTKAWPAGSWPWPWVWITLQLTVS